MLNRSLKRANAPIYASFLLANLCLIGAILFGVSWLLHEFQQVKAVAISFTALFTIAIAGAINELISSHWKAVLVYWRLRDPLPGARAFTHFAPQDPRIDLAQLRAAIGDFPTDASQQNALWYRLFRKHESSVSVEESHKQFLLYRDMATASILIAVTAAPIILLVGHSWHDAMLCSGAALLEYSLLALSAANCGRRLVTNVLAQECIPQPTSTSARSPRRPPHPGGLTQG